jgi:4-hydroxybenzoate polyprenyltransferase
MSGILHKIKIYMELVRFSHTIFALPFALASLFYASQGWPAPLDLLWIIVCMIAARNAAMAYNRLIDSDIDSANPRTRNRHIPAGILKSKETWFFIILNLVVFSGVAALLNPLAFWLSFPVALLLLSYSWFKRFTWLCHFWLGIVIGLSPLGAWVALNGTFALFPLQLSLILALWIAGFDIIYASQDAESDQRAGLHSAFTRFGFKGAFNLARVFHLALILVMFWTGYSQGFGPIWWSHFGLSVAILLWLHFFMSNASLEKLNDSFFKANALISLSTFITVVLLSFE